MFKYKKDNLSLEFPDNIIAIPIVALETWTTLYKARMATFIKSKLNKSDDKTNKH